MADDDLIHLDHYFITLLFLCLRYHYFLHSTRFAFLVHDILIMVFNMDLTLLPSLNLCLFFPFFIGKALELVKALRRW